MNSLRFIFCLHNHQPVGNFDHVIEESFQLAYQPFLNLAAEYPDFRFSLHTSGCLLEWIETKHPEYFDQLREMVARGQAELLTGAMYEPILPIWSEREIRTQIERQTDYMQRHFGVSPSAFWLPERVWEPHLAAVLHDSGVTCLPLDDLMFLSSGLTDEQLFGHFVTEHEGKTVHLFPVPQRLRYTIPFADPLETIAFLRAQAERAPGLVATYGDDGEKFGSWPETHKHVYTDGWLKRFIEAVLAEKDWLQLSHFGEIMADIAPSGKVYLGTGSYREMTEWALPPRISARFDDLWHQFEHEPQKAALRGFVTGGFWRNFLAKYAESNRLSKSVLHFTQSLAATSHTNGHDPIAAQTHLLRAQCNCPYWHGVFGGLYLPHLRSALYEEIGRARALLPPERPAVHIQDHDGDGHDDVFIETPHLDLHLAPARGGTLELILQHDPPFNWGCTLTRREEAYHRKLKAATQGNASGETKSIHDIVRTKEPGLEKYLSYDRYDRASLIDHFISPEGTLAQFTRGEEPERGDFTIPRYDIVAHDHSSITLRRRGQVGSAEVTVAKQISAASDKPTLDIHYTIETKGKPAALFGCEWNLTALAPTGPDRWVEIDGRKAGDPNATQENTNVHSFALYDGWGKKAIRITADRSFTLWRFGLHTVSLSESGFERVYQQTVFCPLFELTSHDKLDLKLKVELLKL